MPKRKTPINWNAIRAAIQLIEVILKITDLW